MNKNQNVQTVNFESAIAERYLSYALSTITSRSLPDVRDGLKPVHRRLLYAMMLLKLDPKTGFKKCARVVGDVIGKYHPHGDTAVYDALVRMAQTFASRHIMIEGQGNFGSIDGDNQAAMRYTEARLTEYAMQLLKDIDQNTVDFRPNYDGSDEEPVVLPSAVPNILANGTEGIAVGMATSIPPHNLGELCDAAVHLIKHPNCEVSSLLKYVKGPDFPTGGILIEPADSVARAYNSGKGSFKLRAKWEKEELDRGQYRIVITEIPYQVQKRNLIEKMADLFNNKKLPFLESFQDMSAEDIRIVLLPKSRNIDPNVLMESLFKLTDLEIRVQLNMNVLNAKSAPMVMNLKEVLVEFLAHRQEVTTRRLNYRLGNINRRLEILAGLLIAYLNLDEVIRIIREEDEPKQIMMSKWDLTELQVESILNMRLRALRKLEELQIKTENDALLEEKAGIESLLGNEDKLWGVISDELKEVKKLFKAEKRRTEVAEAPDIEPISMDAFIEKEPLTVICSEMGWLKAVKGYDAGGNTKYKEGDKEKYLINAMTTDKILAFSNYGKFYTLPCDKITRGKGHGEPLRLVLGMEQGEDIVTLFKYVQEEKYLLASRNGKGFIISAPDLLAQTKSGKQIMTCKPGEALVCVKVTGDSVVSLGQNRKMLIFPISEIPEMKRGQGVMLQKFKQGGLEDIKIINLEEGLSWKVNTRMRTLADLPVWQGKRASAGRIVFSKIWIDK